MAESIIGKRFGKRVVLARAPDKFWPSGYKQIMLRMRCDCGTVSVEQQCNIKSGRANSCGCDIPRLIAECKTTHGYTRNRKHDPIYSSWAGMLQRCKNKNFQQWKDYGGRGIKVCRRWKKFENFLADMGEGWFAGATIERTNVNRGYNPRNCIWITRAEQGRNTRTVRRIAFRGQTKLLTDWIRETGITSIPYRLKMGWSVERALTQKTK